MRRDEIAPVIKKMREKIADNETALFLLNIIESFMDRHEEEFRDLRDDFEEFLKGD